MKLLSHSALPSGVGRRIRRKRQKLMGCDKNSLTKWQREKKITTIILIKTIYTACNVLTTQSSACS